MVSAARLARWEGETDLEIVECLSRYHMLLKELYGLTYRVNITRLIMDITGHPTPRAELCRVTELLGKFLGGVESGKYVVNKDGNDVVPAPVPRGTHLKLVPAPQEPPP